MHRAPGPPRWRRAGSTFGDGTSARLVIVLRPRWPGASATARATTPSTTRPSTPAAGDVLRRVNMVKSEAPALVWERYPGYGARGHGRPRGARLPARGRDDAWRARTCTRSAISTTTTSPTRAEEVSAVRFVAPDRRPPPAASARATCARGRGRARRGRPTASRTRCRPSTSPTASATTCATLGFDGFSGADRVLVAHAGRRRHRPGRRPRQQREHVHAARGRVADHADVPVAARRSATVSSGSDAAVRLPRVHARALQSARRGRRRHRRAEHRAGGRDGGGLERLVRAGLPRRPVPDARHGRGGRGRHGRLRQRVLAAALLGAGLPGGREPGRLPGARGGRAPAATPTATSGGSWGRPRCTTTARSGRRCCGICAVPSVRRRRGRW